MLTQGPQPSNCRQGGERLGHAPTQDWRCRHVRGKVCARGSLEVLFRWLAWSVDLTHALLMLLWGIGLPLLYWNRFPRLSQAYEWFALIFVGGSVLSHLAIGECFLTLFARSLWEAAGGFRDRVPFVVLLVNAIAKVRPSARTTVLFWQGAVALSALSVLWYRARKRAQKGSPRNAGGQGPGSAGEC